MAKDVIIIGASGHGKVIADIVIKSGDTIVGFLDDNDSIKDVLGYPVLGKISDCLNYTAAEFIIGIGNNKIRKIIAETYPQLKFYTAIHPHAVIACGVEIGTGTCVMANAVINTSAKVASHCIINSGAIVEHDNIIDDYVHISPGAVLCGTVSVGRCTHIGANAVVKNNLKITDNCIVGIGTVVVKDIDKPGVYTGVPAKELYR